MSTCTSCGRWEPPSKKATACSHCGGALGHSEALQRGVAEAAATGLTVDDYRLRLRQARGAAVAEVQAARDAEQAALREATRSRLIGAGVPQKTAEIWITAWEKQATRDRRSYLDADYWDAGWEWIATGRAQRAEPAQWDHHPTGLGAGSHEQGLGLAWIIFALPATIVLGVILLAAFLLLGQPFWIPVISAVIGLIGGSLLMVFVDSGSWVVIDRLAYHITWVDRHGDAIWDPFLLVALAMPSITTIGLAVLLVAVT
jgi:hypothetical protein